MKRAVSGFLALLLALMMFPFVPSVQTSDYDVPAYAAESTADELDIKEYVANKVDESKTTPLINEQNELIETDYLVEVVMLMVLEDKISPDDEIDDIWKDERYALESVLGQYSINVPVYEGNGKYNIAFVGQDVLNSSQTAQDCDFTENNLNGVDVEGCYYDYDTGIAYIPKTFYEQSRDDGYKIKAQLLVPTSLDNGESHYNVVIENNNSKITSPCKSFDVSASQFNDMMSFSIATTETANNITLDDIHVYLNGDTQEYEKIDTSPLKTIHYYEDSGILDIKTSPMTVSSVRIVIDEKEDKGFLNSVFDVEEAEAGNDGIPSTIDGTPDDIFPWEMEQLSKLSNLDLSDLWVGRYFEYTSWVDYDTGGGGYSYAASIPWLYGWRANASTQHGDGSTWTLAEYIKTGGTDSSGVYPTDINQYDRIQNHLDGLLGCRESISVQFRPPYWETNLDGVDFSGTPGVVDGGWRYETLAAMCGHNRFGTNVGVGPVNRPVGMRVLYVDVDNEYCVLGFICPSIGTQSGVAVYRVGGEGKGFVKVTKSSANPAITDGNSQYDLAGAYYDVYDSTGALAASIGPTDSNGNTEEVGLKKGNYTIRERAGTAPRGYQLDLSTYNVTVTAGQHQDLAVLDKPSGETPGDGAPNVGIRIVKRDYNHQADGTLNGAQGNASLAGARFKVTYYDNVNLNTVADTLKATPYAKPGSLSQPKYITSRTQSDGTVCAAFNVDSIQLEPESTTGTPKYIMPIGTYLIEEIAAPTGYANYKDANGNQTNIQMKAIVRVTQTENGKYAHAKLIDTTSADKTSIITTTTGNKVQDLSAGTNDVVFTNLAPRGDISIMKYGEPTTDQDQTPDKKVPLAGVQFEIVNDSENSVYNPYTMKWIEPEDVFTTLTTDDQGFATTRRQMTENGMVGIPNNADTSGGVLPYGDYLLREVKGPAQDMGYELMDSIPFTISNNYQHVTMTLENKIGTVVQIQKTDSETGKAVRGTATFRILDSNKNIMTFDDFYPSSAKVSTFTTDINGVAKLPAKFMPGTYYIEEVEGPEGYLWSDKLIPFTCTSETVKEHGEYANPMVVEFSDAPAKGQIVLTKKDSETQLPITLASATYDVYASEDIVTQDGTVRAKKGEKVDTIITSDKGAGTSKELYLGKYYVIENAAPEGYLVNDTQTEILLQYAGDRVAVVKAPTDVFDEAVFGYVDVTKNDSSSRSAIKYAGTKFEIRAAENIVGKDEYTRYVKGEVVDYIITDENGIASSTKQLPLGKYEAVETQSPYGYVLDSAPQPVELKYADQNTQGVRATAAKYDLASTGDFDVQKLDRETGKTVFTPGCDIDVYAAEDITTLDGSTHHHKDDWVGTVTTDETGKVTSELNLHVGKYYLKEVNAPAGYVLDANRTYEVEITWDGGMNGHNIYDAAISDMPAKGVITFTKSDAETGKTIPMAGIKAEVYANEDIYTGDGTLRTPKDTKVAELATDENGYAQTGELYLGSYRVVETLAPEGYLINTTPVDVAIVYENQTVSVVMQASQIADENAKGIIEVTKIDKETSKTVPLEGAMFEIRAKTDIVTGDGTVRASAGEVVDTITTDETGRCATKELYLGIYTINEVQAPHGYVLDTTPVDAVLAYKDQYTAIVTAGQSIANTVQKGVISVTKVDDESKLPLVKPGAVFEVKAVEDIVTPDGTKRVSAGEVVDTIETDNTGIAETKALYLGKYDVYETKAPEGYLLTDEVKQVTLSYGDQTEPLVYEMESVEDHAVKGTISVHKEDTDLEEALPNVEYEIRAAEDIITGDGGIHHKQGDVVETIVTDENGNATSGELYLGKYVVVETVQPNGYELDTKEYPVELAYEDQHTAIVHEDMFLYNTPSSVKIKKVSLADMDKAVADTQFIGWDTEKEADIKASFAVYAGNGIEIESSSVDYMGALDTVRLASVSAEKSFDMTRMDIDGDYVVFGSDETAHQGSYVLHVSYKEDGTSVNEDIPFTVNEYDVNAIFAIGDIVPVEAENANCFGRAVAITDGDETGKDEASDGSNEDTGEITQPDAQAAGVMESEDAGDEDKNETDEDTNASGSSDIESDNADDESSNSENESDTDKNKTDTTDTGNVKRVPVVLANGKFVYNVTGEDGTTEFKYIPQGKVGFAEYKPAAGYVSDRTPQYATFDETGRISDTELNGNASDGAGYVDESGEQVLDLVYADDQTKLYISKQDVTNSEELPGNTLSVYEALVPGTVDTDGDIASEEYGELIETWVSESEPHYMELLPQGSYILKEEQAVAGYTIAEDVKFQVNDTGVVQQVKMNNEHEAAVADEFIEMVETSDLLPLLLAGIVTMFASVAGVVWYRRRQTM